MRNVLAVFVAAIVLARAGTADAADPPPRLRHLSMDLDYKRGPGTQSCFSTHDMQLRLIGAFRYDPFDGETPPDLHVAIKVDRQNARFHAELILTLVDGNPNRSPLWVEEAKGGNCVEMLSNVALMAATQVLLYVFKNPKPVPPADTPAQAEVPSPPPAPMPAAPSRALLDDAKAASPPGAPPDPWRVRAVAAGELSFGLVPGAGAGASAGAGLQWGEHVSVNLDLRGLVALSPNDVQNHKVRPYFLGGSFDVCLQQQIAAPLVFVCPAIHAGAWLIPLDQTSHTAYKELRPLVAFGARLGADWHLTSSYNLRTSVALAYSALQHDTRYDGQTGSTALPIVVVASLGIVSVATLVNPKLR
jgi:hypothetical protein